ncbi:MAG: alpha/beta hydrolase [Aphanocapsa sp. GSE-SYN-MK-11-07L]|jgi:proline iminopeptidase|nr:alpha/beta hydrolase [Aphanocapsa sp. GSE-SYN-MK-11-07L]
MPYLNLRGVEHYYQWMGDAPHSPGKPVMVFMHGWGGSARYWESTAQAFSDRFDCLLYDLRGFGRSLLPVEPLATDPGYELETYAEDLALLLDQLELDRIYLIAHSTGSSIAVFFANLYPERLEQLILTCSGIFEYQEVAFKQFHQFGGYVVKFRPRWLSQIPFMDRLFMARFLRRPIPADQRQAFMNDFLQADYAAALGTMLTAVSKKAAEVMPTEFARLCVPTLLISGQYDIIIPAQMGEQAASLSPQVNYRVIPETAHFPMLEDASGFLACVQEFLSRSQA